MTNDLEILREATMFRKIRALARTMRKGTEWKLCRSEEKLVLRHHRQCPLTFGYRINTCGTSTALQLAQDKGFDMSAAYDIMASADDSPNGNKRLRSILLRAAGLYQKP